ncbi:hypothetical protein NJB93_07760 [Brucella intermedia]|uniref:Uncharacterized protein n=1 Tax=Brucella pseudintermedia TaxID=370111 RepID=A0ABY5UDM0_9HYPH|nr:MULTISPECIES: hypothetical protein [Brucella]MCO7726486.1 hypothetical protein [Brucella intermedia]UWL61428.1 hypothetical protein NIK97_01090 [Brucella pseudintermedia]
MDIRLFRRFARRNQIARVGVLTSRATSWRLNVNRNGLYLIIGALIVVAAGLAVYVYREETKPAGIEMKIGEDGVSIQEN